MFVVWAFSHRKEIEHAKLRDAVPKSEEAGNINSRIGAINEEIKAIK